MAQVAKDYIPDAVNSGENGVDEANYLYWGTRAAMQEMGGMIMKSPSSMVKGKSHFMEK